MEDLRRDLVRYILIGLLCTLIGLITPVITKSFIDGVIPLAAKNQAVQICILVFVCNISAMLGSLSLGFQDFRIGIPGMLLQVFGGYLFIKYLLKK